MQYTLHDDPIIDYLLVRLVLIHMLKLGKLLQT